MIMILSRQDIYSIQCDTVEHNAYKIYAGFMVIIYPLGIPALYAWLLWRNKHKLSSKNNASVRMLSRHSDISLRPTRFLWKSYTPNMYYWEVVECFRRLLLTGGMLIIAPGEPALQATVACMLTVVSGFITVYLRPHADALESKIYVTGVLLVFLSFLLSLIQITDVISTTEVVTGGMLIALNLVMMVTAACQIYMVSRRAYLTRQSSVLGLNMPAAVGASESPAAAAAVLVAVAATTELDNDAVLNSEVASDHQDTEKPELRF
jgi:hypothetical protein